MRFQAFNQSREPGERGIFFDMILFVLIPFIISLQCNGK